MKMKPGQKHWMVAKASQQTTIDRPAFIWSVDAQMNGFLYFLGRDKFEEGKGEMLIKMNGIVNIVNEQGPKLDEASMQRYLGEMVWFPSLALIPYIQWEAIDKTTARATMIYKETKASGTFYFNANGDVIRYSALRYKGNENDAKKYGWEMHILAYNTFEGIKVPSRMTSVWKLDEGDWTWLELEVSGLTYNDKKLQ